MPRVRPISQFLEVFGQHAREGFLAHVTTPYLYFPELPTLPEFGSFAPSATESSDVLASALMTPPTRPGLLKIAKDASNSDFANVITLGRTPTNDLIVPDDRVSKFHVCFGTGPAGWSITDAKSTNGTRVDGSPIVPNEAYPLRSGSTIELSGSIAAVFLDPPSLYDLAQALKASA